jgi:hypothetical protein
MSHVLLKQVWELQPVRVKATTMKDRMTLIIHHILMTTKTKPGGTSSSLYTLRLVDHTVFPFLSLAPHSSAGAAPLASRQPPYQHAPLCCTPYARPISMHHCAAPLKHALSACTTLLHPFSTPCQHAQLRSTPSARLVNMHHCAALLQHALSACTTLLHPLSAHLVSMHHFVDLLDLRDLAEDIPQLKINGAREAQVEGGVEGA